MTNDSKTGGDDSDRFRSGSSRVVTLLCVALWLVVIFLPLVVLLVGAIFSQEIDRAQMVDFALTVRTFAWAGLISVVAVLAGCVGGRCLAASGERRYGVLLLLLLSLVLPRYVLYYGWTLLLSPTTALGGYLSSHGDLARMVNGAVTFGVLILWYWPLAALLIGQGWRTMDPRVRESALLETGRWGVFRWITLGLLSRWIVAAYGVCFILCVSEFSTFHLSGMKTIGTELAVLYVLTGSESAVVAGGWLLIVAAILVGVFFGRFSQRQLSGWVGVGNNKGQVPRWCRNTFYVLVGFSLVAPVGLLVGHVREMSVFGQFFRLHMDELGWSLFIAIVGGVMSFLMAYGAVASRDFGRMGRRLSLVMRVSLFAAMFAPATVVAVGLLKFAALAHFPQSLRQSWLMVSAGQASRFAGVALIMLMLIQVTRNRQLSEMAQLDGASRFQSWWYVVLGRSWPLYTGGFVLLVMFCITELSATMILLPAGLANFSQRLLNQMHYARDQQVIASCLVLIGLFVVLTGAVVMLFRVVWQRSVLWVILGLFLMAPLGCEETGDSSGNVNVVGVFGRTGRGQSEFLYPRAIDIAKDGTLYVVDKSGRIQLFSSDGSYISQFSLPQIDAGYPTGLSVAANGEIYVADTHYHRVLIFSAAGEPIGSFGSFGQGDGEFIYPTDIAFSGDGRIFVSEYGGNDRISAFTEDGKFQFSFSQLGSGKGDLSRPSALCVDQGRRRLYVANACNHRIQIYDFDGHLQGTIGTVGRGQGELRYPYDLALLSDGRLMVCEFGNNRIQLFEPGGKSVGIYGGAGRSLGQLAYPWGVAVYKGNRVFVLDAGNNRVQVWRF